MFGASATHALRAIAFLAGRPREQAVLGRDMARKIRIPSHYLSKVLATLARAGVLTASRGARGGYRLARPASRIRLIEVVGPFEGARARPGCLLRPGKACRSSGACSAHQAWRKVKEPYLDFLERTTVEDIQGGS
ncbi:MAG: Rrf2 family transcriptional regulator [Deltaproteobacteria bacterium]|nr:Rrf2 family transcriptional regulator [Deltaproteobacteria bacterium]